MNCRPENQSSEKLVRNMNERKIRNKKRWSLCTPRASIFASDVIPFIFFFVFGEILLKQDWIAYCEEITLPWFFFHPNETNTSDKFLCKLSFSKRDMDFAFAMKFPFFRLLSYGDAEAHKKSDVCIEIVWGYCWILKAK